MSTNIVNQNSFLRTSRNFPEEAQPLAVEVNRTYLDIAEKMNSRTIGVYSTMRPAQNGETWYIDNRGQKGFREVYSFTTTGNIAHGINFTGVVFISPLSYGTVTDGTNWYGAIYASNVAIAGQVSFYVTNTNIVVLAGAGAPAITSGYINLEWISQT